MAAMLRLDVVVKLLLHGCLMHQLPKTILQMDLDETMEWQMPELAWQKEKLHAFLESI